MDRELGRQLTAEDIYLIHTELIDYIGEPDLQFYETDNGDVIMHYGMPRRSGRYPWGSGDDPFQHSGDFLSRIETLKAEGWKETPENIKKEFGLTTTDYRTYKSVASTERRALNVKTAKSLSEDGLGASEIGKRMGVNESTVRSWLNEESANRMNKARATADFLKQTIDKKGMIDVGNGVEFELNVSREKLKEALSIIEAEGYPVYKGGVPNVTMPGKQTNQVVACPPGTEHKEIYNYDQINSVTEYITRDGGNTYEKKFHYPESMDSSRLKIRYADEIGPDGIKGIEKDGVIELRRGVDDLSLGESRYSQVRILVDGTHYLKGMAVYSDNMPDGVDVIFNTNKKPDKSMKEVLKEIKNDPENPFGSAIKDIEKGGQYWYEGPDGEKRLGLINKRSDQGDWSDWKDKLPAQFLSKQPLKLAEKQLQLAKDERQAEFDELKSLTNPTIKKYFLDDFAQGCDAAAVSLQAAALPGQKYHVILPINSLKDDEVYAPNYDDGTKLALVRYPHGGTFEIPILTVNNKNKVAREIIGADAQDAVGITSKVAERLSGADFDGDTVMCIPTHDPNGRVKIKSTPELPGLKGFDSKQYQYDGKPVVDEEGNKHYFRNGHEFKVMSDTQKQMGVVSNLITDMTLLGAKPDELAAAVRHSMVVIDAEKHKLDYKQSEIDNNIAALKQKYQTHIDENGNVKVGGASTLLSKSKGEATVDKRQGSPKVNIKGSPDYDPSRPEGALLYKTADDVEYIKRKVNARTGEVTETVERRHQKSTRMAETDDARTLISDADTPMERAYADYANTMKDMANKARLEVASTGKIAYNREAAKTYKTEVESLNAKLEAALLNHPKERQAQRLANAEVNAKKQANPDMSKGDIKKASQKALTKYREMLSAKKAAIKVTDKEWEAIQKGAISENQLRKILNNSDKDRLRELATPRNTRTISQSKINRIVSMRNSNYTLGEIARKMGISASEVSRLLKDNGKTN